MSWDDGSHKKVKKVQLTFEDVIYSIQVTYEGALQSHLRGSIGPKSAEFTLDSDEYITALSAYGKTFSTQEAITALTFTTNKRTLGPYGNKSGYQISAPAATGKQIAGFLGTSSSILNSIEVHYAPTPTPSGGSGETGGTGGSGGTGGTGGSGGSGGTGGTDGSGGTGGSGGSGAQKLEAQGGAGGTAWDDGSNYEGVTKVYVRSGGEGIQFVKFDYVKDGQKIQGPLRGAQNRGITTAFEINHPDEYLVSVEGWYGSVVTGIQFKTNLRTSDLIGYDFDSKETKFNLQVEGKKIIGFHGSASNYLNSIGAYFVPKATTTPPSTPVKKLEAKGGETGAVWDDGHHDDVKKVYVGQGNDGVSAVKFEYINGSQVVFGDEHGQRTGLGYENFELEAGEYITSVEGTYDQIFGYPSAVLTMLVFKTNLNKKKGPFGIESQTRFEFKEEGYKITGFHGRAGDVVHAIGAYLGPIGTTPLKPAHKLEGAGGEGGTVWDDGAFDGVRKVSIGQGNDGIVAVKFVYNKGAQVIVGDEHGKPTLLYYEDFEIDYPSEYITEVSGTYDKIAASNSSIVTMLKFKTNKRTSDSFGLEAGNAFVFKKESHKIVGFHGRVGDFLHKFGVHVAPITN